MPILRSTILVAVATCALSNAAIAQPEGCDAAPDAVFLDGTVITMDPGNPEAEAFAIKADRILAVGSSAEIAAFVLPDCPTATTELGGLTVLPGFNDAHNHWFSWGEQICSVTGETTYWGLPEIMDMLSADGWTSISELNFGRPDWAPAHFDNAMALDSNNQLSVRVNGYWGTYDDPSMIDVLADAGRAPDRVYSERVKAPGVKIYVDNPFGHFDILSQEQVDALVERAHASGWQVAAHAVNHSAVEKILSAYERVLGSDSNEEYRHRIEHAVKVSDDQLARMQAKGIIASFQLLGPPDWPAQSDFGERFLTDHPEWVLRWNDMIDAEEGGARNTGSSDAPFNDSPCDPSPMRLIYQATTRDGYADRTPADWELAQRISVEDAIKLLTIDAAYATFDEEVKGSLEPGKLADFVVLSANPLDVAVPEDLLDIHPYLTIVGGSIEYCDELSAPRLCAPAESFAVAGGVARASRYIEGETPDRAFDGSEHTVWNAGDVAPQWIEIVLDEPLKISRMELVVEMTPNAHTTNEIWAHPGPGEGEFVKLDELSLETVTGQTLTYTAPWNPPAYQIYRIVTTENPTWVAWREIRLVPYSAVSSEADSEIPPAHVTLTHHPNPVRERTTISIEVDGVASDRHPEGEVSVYDIFGRVVRTWDVSIPGGGTVNLVWDGTDGSGRSVANGVYPYRFSYGERSVNGRMILAR